MKKYFKNYWKFFLFVLICGLIGGYFSGIYLYGSLSEEVLKQIQQQNLTKELFSVIVMLQYAILYGLLLAIIGVFISKKVDLWKKFKYDKNAFKITMIITIIGALLLYPGDKLIFGRFSSFVSDQYVNTPTFAKIISGLLLGGVIEEVMMRLFLMSLFVYVISKLFYKKEKTIPSKVYIISNIITAILFALGHLPSTMSMTTLTPALIIRCFLFNGGLGLLFGYLYKKYGIAYAMISHGLCHLFSDIFMILFV